MDDDDDDDACMHSTVQPKLVELQHICVTPVVSSRHIMSLRSACIVVRVNPMHVPGLSFT